MKIGSVAHGRLTVGLFALVIGGMFAVNFYVTDGGWAGIARVAVPVSVALVAGIMIDRISKGARSARG